MPLHIFRVNIDEYLDSGGLYFNRRWTSLEMALLHSAGQRARPQQQEDLAQAQREPPRGVGEEGQAPKLSILQAFGLICVS